MKKNIITLVLILFCCDLLSMAAVVLPEDTLVSIRIDQSISSANAAAGDRIQATVAEDVIVDGITVISEGTPVKAEIQDVSQKGRIGKGGNLSIRVISTKSVNNTTVHLTATQSAKGKDNNGSTVALTVLFGLPGLLRRGKDAVIPTGTIIKSYVEEGIQI